MSPTDEGDEDELASQGDTLQNILYIIYALAGLGETVTNLITDCVCYKYEIKFFFIFFFYWIVVS